MTKPKSNKLSDKKLDFEVPAEELPYLEQRVLMQIRKVKRITRQRFHEYAHRNSLRGEAVLSKAMDLLEKEEGKKK